MTLRDDIDDLQAQLATERDANKALRARNVEVQAENDALRALLFGPAAGGDKRWRVMDRSGGPLSLDASSGRAWELVPFEARPARRRIPMDVVALILAECDGPTHAALARVSFEVLQLVVRSLYKTIKISDHVSLELLASRLRVGPSARISTIFSQQDIGTLLVDLSTPAWPSFLALIPALPTGFVPFRLDHLVVIDCSCEAYYFYALFICNPVRFTVRDLESPRSSVRLSVMCDTLEEQLACSLVTHRWDRLEECDLDGPWVEVRVGEVNAPRLSVFHALPMAGSRNVVVRLAVGASDVGQARPLKDLKSLLQLKSFTSFVWRRDITFSVVVESEEDRQRFLVMWRECDLGKAFGDETVCVRF